MKREIHAFVQASLDAFLQDLKTLVGTDCGTYTKRGVDEVGRWVNQRGFEWGWDMQYFPQSEYGDCWLARLYGEGEGKLILLGHLDTVYPEGTCSFRPMRREGNRLLGPGVGDMKSGLLAGMYALRALQVTGVKQFRELAFFFNSDEEVGSPVSRHVYAPFVQAADAALVLEGARANGNIVSARKGVGQYRITVKGQAAHAGVEPEKGASAIVELAHQILAVHALNGLAPGVTFNAGVVGGGTRANVVPDEAWVQCDVRAVDAAGAERAHQAIMALGERTHVPRTTVSVEGHFEYVPMVKTPAIAFMAELAEETARELGMEIRDEATGGASDANTVASWGIPVLDGLGPVGGLDHSPNEYIELDSIVPRTTLLAGLILRLLERRAELVALR